MDLLTTWVQAAPIPMLDAAVRSAFLERRTSPGRIPARWREWTWRACDPRPPGSIRGQMVAGRVAESFSTTGGKPGPWHGRRGCSRRRSNVRGNPLGSRAAPRFAPTGIGIAQAAELGDTGLCAGARRTPVRSYALKVAQWELYVGQPRVTRGRPPAAMPWSPTHGGNSLEINGNAVFLALRSLRIG